MSACSASLRTILGSVLCLAVVATPVAASDGWTTDFEAARKAAAKSEKDLLVEFTGSDWCPPCKKLKKRVFDSDVFQEAAPKHFVLVKLDFPRDKSGQPQEVTRQNQRLKKRFNVSAFPTILLADAQARPYAMKRGYGGTGANAYTKELLAARKDRQVRDKYLAAAADAEGLKKAKLLDKALSGIDPQLVPMAYEKEAKQIVAIDSKNTAGLRAKYQSILKLPAIKERLKQIRRKARGSSPKAALKQVHTLLQEKEPKGVALQEVRYLQALLNYKAENQKKAIRLLQSAMEAAPETSKAAQIRKILKQMKQRR